MTELKGETFVISDTTTPPVSFSTLVFGLASTTLIHLGEAPNPDTGNREPNQALARQSLSLLEVLEEKTRGNLSPEEERLFQNLLADLRLKYVRQNQK